MRGKMIKVSKYPNCDVVRINLTQHCLGETNNAPSKAAFKDLMRVGVSVNFIGKEDWLKF